MGEPLQQRTPLDGTALERLARALPGDGDVLGMVTDRGWRQVYTIPGLDGPEGKDAAIWVSRVPAMFWRVTGAGMDVCTGSGLGMAELALLLARAIADGLLGATEGDGT